MKRLVPIALALMLGLVPAHVPAATPAIGLSQQQATELVASYAHLTSEFYKKVDKQAVLDGARTNVIAYLKLHGVASPSLEPLRASDDDATNARNLEREVASTVNAYAAKIGDKKDPKDAKSPLVLYGPKTGAQNITYAAISGALGAVKDKYTVFLSPKEYSELNEGLDGTDFGGVGLSYDIDEQSKTIHVQNVIIDGPAEKAGVLSEDYITAVDGKNVHDLVVGKPPEAQTKIVSGLLRGEAGTKVQLTIQRSGQALTAPVSVTRAVIHSPSVNLKMLPNGIGWVQLTVFGSDTANELNRALARLDSQGAKAYVLDLRYNGGGYLNAAVDVSSKFIASGPIVTVESRAGTNTEYDAENVAIAPRPLAVLVNHYTASASEITAGAIQDSGVGTVIGTKTYGKGVVQSIYPLGDGSAVKITTARYLTPHGRDINTVGITPDLLADLPKDAKIRPGDPAKDPQLQQAMTFLQGKIAALDSTK
ncbi:MAG: S41 family peptidase [Candidatus Velthaea sp.]